LIKHVLTVWTLTSTLACLVTKQRLMVFGRQTFIVCPGPLVTHFNISMFGHQTIFDGVWPPNIYRLSRQTVNSNKHQQQQQQQQWQQ